MPEIPYNVNISRIDVSGFLTNIGHEVRIPMNMILGSADLISHENINKKIHDSVNNIRQAADMLLGMTEDIIDLIRMSSGDLVINESEYRTEELLVEIRSNLEGRALSAGIDVDIHIDGALPYRLIGDRERIRLMVEKLVSNALALTSSGNMKFGVRIMKGGAGTCFIKFDIIDGSDRELPEEIVKIVSGVEISADDNITTSDGNAVRVFIVKNLATMMGGKLTAISTRTGSNVLSLLIAQKTVGVGISSDYEIAEAEIENDDPETEIFSAPTARILIVDEAAAADRKVIHTFKKFLIDVDIVDNGEQAVELCRFIDYDVVLVGSDPKYPDAKMLRDSLKELDGRKMLSVEAFGTVIEGFEDVFDPEDSLDDQKAFLKKHIPAEKINIVSRTQYTGSGLEALENLGLNTKGALANFNGDEDEYKDVLLTLCRSSDTKGKLLSHYIETHDYKNYIVAMHGILGVARVIGADWLATKSRELEKAAKQGVYGIIEKETGVLSEYFDKLLSSIKTVLSKEPSETIMGEIGKEDLISIINELREYLDEYQLDEVEELFFTLAQFSCPDPKVMELIHDAEEHMLDYNYTEVANCLDEVLEILGRG
ncbi:MAG: hybrid sensor histidine kinase/response regulator [Lachnospiraceae bacterium]|nr:hybrid sensor histidine kinase/response regulator [Lachnospiraceae bacterium]